MLTGVMAPADAERFAADRFRMPSADRRIPVRNRAVKGPLAPNGDWLIEKAGTAAASLAVAKLPASGDVTYEIVNFMDGQRTVSEIRDAVSAEFEPVPLGAVGEYIDMLVRFGAVAIR